MVRGRILATIALALACVSACSLLWPYEELEGEPTPTPDALAPDAGAGADASDVTQNVRPTWSRCASVGWCALGPDTVLLRQCPPSTPTFSSPFCPGILDSPNSASAVADIEENVMVLWGGNDTYQGNEVYALVLNDSPYVERRSDPSAHTPCAETNTDGTPTARNTYDGLAYVSTYDVMFVFGGDCVTTASSATWALDLAGVANTSWKPQWGPLDAAFPGTDPRYPALDYNPTTNEVLVHTFTQFARFDVTRRVYEKLLDDDAIWRMTGRVDPNTGTFVLVGGGADESGLGGLKIFKRTPRGAYDVRNETQRAKASGTCDDIFDARAPGLAFDPIWNRFVLWPNDGSSVYMLDLDTVTCRKLDFEGGPPPMAGGRDHGTRGRFRYFPKLGVFVVVPTAGVEAYALRLPDALP